MLGLILLKPTALEDKNVLKDFYQEIKNSNLQIIEEKMVQIDKEIFPIHQPCIIKELSENKPCVLGILREFERAESKIFLLKGMGAIQKTHNIKLLIRNKFMDYSLTKRNSKNEIILYPPNYIHAPSDKEELLNDILVFFPEKKFIINYLIEEQEKKKYVKFDLLK
jgi:nucleoside diphosphate kinase